MATDVKFESLSPSEWFRRNKELAGFANPSRALYQAVRELIENALDATETFGIHPFIKAYMKYAERENWLSIYVEDNGIGIPKDEIPNVFGRVFYSSKYKVKQHRGIFGLGAKMVILYAQSTTNKPITVISAPLGSDKVYRFDIMIDTLHNDPLIKHQEEWDNKYKWHGTAVHVVMEGDWLKAKHRVEEYIKRVAMVAPYAEIHVKEPDGGVINIERVTLTLPTPPKEGLPHPKSIDIEVVKQLISRNGDSPLAEFLVDNFDGVGDETAINFLKSIGIDSSKSVKELSMDEVTHLVTKMREFNEWRRPRADWLSPVGAELLEQGIKKILEPEAVFATTRKPSSYSGNPFIVEAAIAWGGKIEPSDRPVIYRFANKVPLLYDEGNDVVRHVVDEVDWNLYKVKFPASLVVVVHICSTKIPYASAGKEAIADVPEIESEVRLAIREVARRLRVYLSRKEKEKEAMVRYAMFTMFSREVASSIASIIGLREDQVLNKLKKIISRKIKYLEAIEEVEDNAEQQQQGEA